MPYMTLGGRSVEYTIERKAVKNINLRIRPDGSIFVSANKWVPQEKIEDFVQSNAAMVLRAVDRVSRTSARASLPEEVFGGEQIQLLGTAFTLVVEPSAREKIYISKQTRSIVLESKTPQDAARLGKKLDAFITDFAADIFEQLCRGSVYPYFERQGIAYPRIKVRRMTSRWGSCIKSKGIITFNRQLIFAPLPCVQYVATHEFCHLIHGDHSRRFYALLESLMPNYRECKKLLDGGADNNKANRG